MTNYGLVTQGLQEIIGDNDLREICAERELKVFWGTAPTGQIHIAYYTPLLKIAQMVQAGCQVTILIADLHALLDNLKSTEKQVKYRTDYYQRTIECMLTFLGVDLDNVTIVRGSSFQTDPKYTMDMYKLNTITTLREARHAGAEVVKQAKNPTMTSLLYPTLQALDEEYLHVDAQLGGIDQRKIFMYAREFLPKLGYKKRIHLFTPMVPGLRTTAKKEAVEDEDISNKMSASVIKTKLDMLDTRSQIKKKINSAYCVAENVDDNSVIDTLRWVIFPVLDHLQQEFEIFRREEHGGPITFDTFEAVLSEFQAGALHPADLKAGVAHNIDKMVEPVRKEFESREWRQILKHAYE